MRDWSPDTLRREFDRAVRLGWIAHVVDAARRYTLPTYDLLAIGSRETGLDPRYLHETGDGGNGFGLMQIDRRWHPSWVATGKWRTARACFFKGAEVYDEQQRILTRLAGSRRVHNKAPFVWPRLEPRTRRRVAIAAYNAGAADAAASYARHGHPDRYTTHGDYSADVLARAEHFRAFLSELKETS